MLLLHAALWTFSNTAVPFPSEKPSVHSPHITDLKTSGLFGELACDFCTIQIGVAVIPAVSSVFPSVQGATTEKTPMMMS